MQNYYDTIMEILTELEPYEDIDNSTDLIESGILDSLSIVYLVTQLEDKYNITIDENKILPDNFKSVDKIIELLNAIYQE
jgi:acyl carrier protein